LNFEIAYSLFFKNEVKPLISTTALLLHRKHPLSPGFRLSSRSRRPSFQSPIMTNNPINECEQLELLTVDQRVPKDYLVRKLEAAIDFSFIFLTNCP